MPLEEFVRMRPRVWEKDLVNEVDRCGGSLDVQEHRAHRFVDRSAHDRIAGRAGK